MLKPFSIAIAVWIALVFVGLPAQADIRAKLKTWFEISEVETVFEGFPDVMAEALAEGHAADFDISKDDIRKVAERHFGIKILVSDLQAILAVTAREEDVDRSIAFHKTPFGKRILEIETKGYDLEIREEREREGARLFAELEAAGSPRITLYNRINVATGSEEAGAAFVMNLGYVFMTAVYSDPSDPNALSHEQILALLNANSASIKAEIKTSQNADAAYVYRDLSDAELVAYLEELEAPSTMALTKATVDAMRRVMLERSRAFGLEYRDLLNQRRG